MLKVVPKMHKAAKDELVSPKAAKMLIVRIWVNAQITR